MLLTVLLDPHGPELYRAGAVALEVGLLWLWYRGVKLLALGLILWLGVWSVQRLLQEAKRDNPRESIVWLGLVGLCLMGGMLIVSWRWVADIPPGW